jgi:hypothetical protein
MVTYDKADHNRIIKIVAITTSINQSVLKSTRYYMYTDDLSYNDDITHVLSVNNSNFKDISFLKLFKILDGVENISDVINYDIDEDFNIENNKHWPIGTKKALAIHQIDSDKHTVKYYFYNNITTGVNDLAYILENYTVSIVYVYIRHENKISLLYETAS